MIKRFLTNLIYRAFGWGALFFCLFLGFASGAVIALAAIAYLNQYKGEDTGYRSGVSYSDASNIVTRADMARCFLMENRSPDPEPPEDATAILQSVGYTDETLLSCSDELDRAAYDIVRKRADRHAATRDIQSAAVKKKR